MTTIYTNLQAVYQRIVLAARQFGRDPAEISLLAVSKTKSAELVKEAIAAGQTAFGENFVQEGVKKIASLTSLKPCWHFIGSLQSNKTRLVAENFDWVHSVDRLKIAQRLNHDRPDSMAPLQICLQVNISEENTKSGLDLQSDEIKDLAKAVACLPKLKLRGLMCIPAEVYDFDAQRRPFLRLRGIFMELKKEGFLLDTLSMGMSHDLEAAIAEGATMVRIGTAVFGERNR